MDTKLKNNNRISFLTAFLLVTAAVVFFCLRYPVFEENVWKYKVNFLQSDDFLTDVYKGNAVLYRDLAERVAEKNVRYRDLFLDIVEEPDDTAESYVNMGDKSWREVAGEAMDSTLELWENQVYSEDGMARISDYCLVDHATGIRISNTDKAIDQLGAGEVSEELKEDYPYYLKMSFGDTGYLKQVSVRGENPDELLKAVQDAMRSKFLAHSFQDRLYYSIEDGEIYYYYADSNGMKATTTVYNTPRNCTVCYAFSRQQVENLFEGNSWRNRYCYLKYSGVCGSAFGLLAVLAAFAFLLPLWKRYTLHRSAPVRLPVEIAALMIFLELSVITDCLVILVSAVNGGSLAETLGWLLGLVKNRQEAAWAVNVALLYLAFGIWYYLVSALGQVWELGLSNYMKQRSLICRYKGKLWGFCKRTVKRFEDELLHADLGEKTNKAVFRGVAVNFVILGILMCLWPFRWPALILYSVVLYIVVRKYVRKIKKQYGRLLGATESIAGGNLQTEFDSDWGVFESYKKELAKIQSGFYKAVEEEVKSQKMKTDLITNVSHDLKTPLTAITTYIELLKEEDLTGEQRKEYLAVLEKKALRLKTLIEDLFEVSKASSGNVTLNFQEVDIGNLMRQVYLEYEDKVEDADLIFRFRMPEEKIILKLDSEKTYRIFENLYTNIIKYAMPHTRVYVSLEKTEEEAVIELKNMSSAELNIPEESLTERFVRGDSSRNTEGSGLGLAIAKNFVELQKGQMKVDIDGDLFKVTLRWRGIS